MSVKYIDLYKLVREAESRKVTMIDGTFKRINNQSFDINTMEQTKTLMTCTDNKRWILDDNAHTLASVITGWRNEERKNDGGVFEDESSICQLQPDFPPSLWTMA